MPSIAAVRKLLRDHGQEHLLAFLDDLDERQRDALVEQIGAVDFERLDALIRSHVLAEPRVTVPESILPAPILPSVPKPAGPEETAPPVPHPTTPEAYEVARRRGGQLIADGKVAALVVAGGEGTRLGFDGPKGCLPVTPARHKPLFQTFAEQLLATRRRYGAPVRWYVMTGPSNDAATREFFAANDWFGLDGGDVFFFTQGRMPAMDRDGKILLADKGRLALMPDGHGGCVPALRARGALEDMARRGIEYISYFQVDNPLVRCVDPLFIGLHDRAGAEASAKAVPKRHPLERVGNFCAIDGKVTVIEYSDLSEAQARAIRPDGTLLLGAGSIGVHVFSRAFVEKLTAGGTCRLPFHRAIKKVPHVDAAGTVTAPDAPNAVKLEMFVFDALPLAETAVVLETARQEEFSPVKNAAGPDSIETCLHDQVARAAAWLEAAGVHVPRDADGQVAAVIEISPLLALDAAELAGKVSPDMDIKPGMEVYLA